MYITVAIKINDVSVPQEVNDVDSVFEFIRKLKWYFHLPEDKPYILLKEDGTEILPSDSELCYYIKEGEILNLKEAERGCIQCWKQKLE